MNNQQLILRVAAKAAVTNEKGEVLVVREAASDPDNTKVGKWGLVGGRIKAGESFMDGLKREVAEEIGVVVEPLKPLFVGEWRPVIRGVPHQIIAIFMHCKLTGSKITLSKEHDDFAWILPQERQKIVMVEPDCFVVDELAKLPLA